MLVSACLPLWRVRTIRAVAEQPQHLVDVAHSDELRLCWVKARVGAKRACFHEANVAVVVFTRVSQG